MKDVKALSLNIEANTDDIVNRCRIIAKHLNAMADELTGLDQVDDEQGDILDTALTWLNQLNDKNLKGMIEYGESVLSCRKG